MFRSDYNVFEPRPFSFQFDYYVRTPKVYESYLFYEKTLKSIDDLVEMLA